MFEFSDVFATSTTMSTYVMGSAVCIGVYGLVVIWFLLRHEIGAPRPTARVKIATAVVVAALFVLAGIGAGVSSIPEQGQAAGVGAP